MAVHRVDAPDLGTLFLVDDQTTARVAFTDPRLSRDARNAPDWLRAHVEANQNDTSMGRNMLDSDPPEHTRLRQAVKRAFTPRRVADMRPRVEAVAAGLLDDVAGHDQVDLIETYAFPLPMTVMCDLLGLPHADRADFRAWTVPLVDRGDRDRTVAAGKNMRGYLEQFVMSLTVADEDVDAQPSFTHALLREGQLDHDELVSMLILLLIAGHETTVNLIGNAVVALVNHRDQLPLLRDHAPEAVEELLRVEPPLATALPRIATEDISLDGTEILAGSVVAVNVAAANRDPAHVARPDELDLTRGDTQHLSFGHGTHFCLGAALARMEAQVALTTLVDRHPDIALAVPAEQVRWREGMIRGPLELPVRL